MLIILLCLQNTEICNKKLQNMQIILQIKF